MAVDSGSYTPETLARRAKIAEALMAPPKQPIYSAWQGLAEVAQGALGGYQLKKVEDAERAERDRGNADLYASLGLPAPAAKPAPQSFLEKIGGMLSGGGSPAPVASAEAPAVPVAAPTPPAVAPPAASGSPDYGNAIAGIESGGKYDLTGPVTRTGDKAYGKYQVMGANVPEWTTAALGKPMTPKEFLASPDAQEAVFKQRFGQYVDKYGPEGAAKAWFAGEKGMNNPNAKDVLGTSVQGYADRFNKALGPQAAPYQVAGPDVGPPNPQAAIAAALQGGAKGGAAPVAAPTPAAPGNPQVSGVALPASPTGGALGDIPQDKKLQIAKMLTSRNPTVQAMGQTLLGNYTKADAPTDETKEYKLAQSQGYKGSFIDFKTDLKKAGATQVTTNVGGGSDKQIFDAMDTSATQARTTAAGLTGLREARNALQGGAITGAGANQVLGLQKIGAALGVANPDKIVNTEVFRSAIAPQVASMLKNTVGTTNISNTDREFAEKAAGGNITLDEKSISRLLDIMERAGTAQLEGHQKRLEKVYPDAEKFARERALFGVDMPAPPPVVGPATPPAAVVAPPIQTATNPQTGEKLMLKDGQWVPMK